jgi:negative regulator of flagellin synthesis FlgM
MVNDVKGSSANIANNAAYQAKNTKLEQAKQGAVASSTQQANSLKSAEKDSVALTPQAKQLKDLQKKIADSDGFDRKKVDDLKKAITNGEYKINYETLAAKIAKFEFDI